VNKFAAKFEKDFSLVSFLSTNTILRNVWYVDNGVDVLVAAGGISSWTTFLREEEDSKKSKEDH
jgi:hypothetical protein